MCSPHDEAQARHLTAHGSNRNEDGSYTWKFDNYTHSRGVYGMPFSDVAALWQKIDCPVLLINATDGYSHRIGQAGTLQYFPNAELVHIDHAGHWVHHDQFDQFIDVVRTFMTRVTTP